MIQLKIGIDLASFGQPLKQSLLTAARLGADAVEIDARGELKPREMSQTAVRQVRKMLDDANLRVCAVRFMTRRGYNVLDELDRRVDATKEAMRLAWSLGCRVVVNHVGHISAEPAGAEWELLVESLTDVGRFSQRVGASLAAATGAEEPSRMARLIAALPPGSLGIDLDPGRLAAGGHSAVEAAELLGQGTLHVHATDGARDLAKGRGLETQLGRGVVDYPALLATLEEHGYRGHFTIRPPGTDDPARETGEAIAFLRSLF